MILRQTEDAGGGVSGNLLGSNRSHFEEAEAQITQFVETACFLVETRRESHTVAERQVLPLERRCLRTVNRPDEALYRRKMTIDMQQGDNFVVNLFCVDAE